jgi:hypothetical protein
MVPNQNTPSPNRNPVETRLNDPLDDYLLAKSKANVTGNYRWNVWL